MENNYAYSASIELVGDLAPSEGEGSVVALKNGLPSPPVLSNSAKLKRLIAKLPQGSYQTRKDRLAICLRLLRQGSQCDTHFGDFFSNLALIDRYYWISTLYTLLLSGKRRRNLSAYFTPPPISRHLINVMESYGLRIGCDRILDPASGGSAFLLPLAIRQQQISEASLDRQISALDLVEKNLFGIELDPGLSTLSQAMFSDLFRSSVEARGRDLSPIVIRGSSLKSLDPTTTFDAVLCNPPYGRIFRPSPKLIERWDAVVQKGYVNTYAIFIKLAIDSARDGALIGVVVPTSFISGPSFGKLREYILLHTQILQLDVIEQRQDLFVDVIQDTCVLVLRKSRDQLSAHSRQSSLVRHDGSVEPMGSLETPNEGRGLWVLPSRLESRDMDILEPNSSYFNPKFKTLADYGFVVKSGYFVWNRNRERLADRVTPKNGEVPLLWAHNVKHGCEVNLITETNPSDSFSKTISCVAISQDSTAIIRSSSLILQRTTNNKQQRRLIVGYVPADLVKKYGGYITENHTIVILRDPKTEQRTTDALLLKLLSSKKVDELYRQISGTVSISVKVLRALPLPAPEYLEEALAVHEDVELAIRMAYEWTQTR